MLLRPVRRSLYFAILAPVLLLPGCGPRHELGQAQSLERKGYYVEAGMKYEEIAQRYPKDTAAAEALYRVGNIYQKRLKLYSQAGHYYTRLIENYPKASPWTDLAREGIMSSPDYYPLSQGSFWIEGDSATGGQNMRAEWECTAVSTGTYRIRRRVFAGEKLVTEVSRFYRKENLQLHEFDALSGTASRTLLSYPYFEGKKWKNAQGGNVIMVAIAAKNLTVKVQAGEFAGCIKVSEENPALAGSTKYNYYAPDVGWILTTTASAGGKEHENTELLSYKIVPEKL